MRRQAEDNDPGAKMTIINFNIAMYHVHVMRQERITILKLEFTLHIDTTTNHLMHAHTG